MQFEDTIKSKEASQKLLIKLRQFMEENKGLIFDSIPEKGVFIDWKIQEVTGLIDLVWHDFGEKQYRYNRKLENLLRR